MRAAASTQPFDGSFCSNAMQSEEQNLVSYMDELADCLFGHDTLWPDLLRQHATEAKALFDCNADLADKFDFVNSHNYSTAGMGSLNDGVVPESCKSHQRNLYRTINDLLRIYWKQLGRESHTYSDFALIADGAAVRLIPGKTIFRNGVYSTEVRPGEGEHVWTVVRCDGPDITGMPYYAIRLGNHFRSARHESLAIVSPRVG
jgi:hypothetical protein